MADLKDLAAKRSALLWFPPSQLEIKSGLNARDFTDPANLEHVESIAASIAANGFYPSHPIAIFREVDAGGIEHIFVADGECRWRGAMLAISSGRIAEFTTNAKGEAEPFVVACVPIPRGMNDVDLVLHRNLANTGKRFTPIEEGHNIKHAINLGASITDIAAKLGKSVSYVNGILDWQEAPTEVHKMVAAGEISQTEAAKTVKELGPEAGKKIIKEAVAVAKASGKKKATAKHLKPLKAKPQPTVKPDHQIAIRPMPAGALQVRFGEKPVTMTKHQWRVVLAQIVKKLGIAAEEILSAAE